MKINTTKSVLEVFDIKNSDDLQKFICKDEEGKKDRIKLVCDALFDYMNLVEQVQNVLKNAL